MISAGLSWTFLRELFVGLLAKMLPQALLITVKLDFVSRSPIFSLYLDFMNSPKELNLEAVSLPMNDFYKYQKLRKLILNLYLSSLFAKYCKKHKFQK